MLRKQNINKYRKYEHIMENSHKTRFWIYLSISICLIATGVALGKVTNLTDSQVKQDLFLHELNLKYNELGNELNQAVRDIAVLKSSNLGLSDQNIIFSEFKNEFVKDVLGLPIECVSIFGGDKDIPEDKLAYGNPIKIIKNLKKEEIDEYKSSF